MISQSSSFQRAPRSASYRSMRSRDTMKSKRRRAGDAAIRKHHSRSFTLGGAFLDGMPVPLDARLGAQLQRSDGVSFSSIAGSSIVGYVALVNLGSGHATSGVNGIGGVDAADTLRYNSSILITFTLPGDPS